MKQPTLPPLRTINHRINRLLVSTLGVLVGNPVGVSVGATVGVLVESPVGVLVGTSVGVSVGASVGVLVGAPVGVLVGAPVGVLVGTFISVKHKHLKASEVRVKDIAEFGCWHVENPQWRSTECERVAKPNVDIKLLYIHISHQL